MSDITRPNRPVPTTARRVPPPPPPGGPQVVVVPGMPPVPPPPAGVSQTIVYVQTAPTPEPKRQVEFIPVRRKPARQTGFLAVMSIIIGGLGALAAFRPEVVGWAPVIAATGFCAAVIALFKSAFMTRTTFRAPILGMGVSLIAYVIAIAFNHRLQSQYDRLRISTGDRLPVLSLARFERDPAPAVTAPPVVAKPDPSKRPVHPAAPDPATPPVTAAGPTPSQTPAETPAQLEPRKPKLSWIDPNSGGWMKPEDVKPGTSGTPGAAPTTPPSPTATPAVPTVDLATAEQHLATARAAAAARLNIDYTGAQSAVDSASTSYETASRTSAPGSAELATASQAKLDAKTTLSRVLAELDADPAVAAAEREVKAARGK
jgi:hypothetical protein